MIKPAKRNVNQVARSLSLTVSNIVGCRLIPNEQYGIELELEGRGVGLEEIPTKGWKRHKDGSLRGESVEYVSSSPANKLETFKRLELLFNLFVKYKVSLKNSYRCSTHVHINFSDRSMKDVVNFFCVFTIIEELLEVFCGPERAGNLFCLSNRSAEMIVKLLENSVFVRGEFSQFNEELRYCSINLSALNKFGTIEIRTMRGADSQKQITDWVEILSQLYDFATKKMITPSRLIESLSFLGYRGFLEQIFSKPVLELLLNSWENKETLNASFYEGARLIQVLAYRLEEAYGFIPKVKNEQKKPLKKRRGNFTRIKQGERLLHVPAFPNHGDQCPGIPDIVWSEEMGAWCDLVRGVQLPFVDLRGNEIDLDEDEDEDEE